MSEPPSRTVALPDLAATEALAARLAARATPGDSILLEGDLGAGKTAFARAFLRAASDDPALEVPSPTFTLVQIYETKIGPIFHYDLWRLDGSDSLVELDWDDARDGIVLVEWPDRLGALRPEDALMIAFRMGEGEAREATLTGWGERLDEVAGMSPSSLGRPPPPSPSWQGASRPSTRRRPWADGWDTPDHADKGEPGHDDKDGCGGDESQTGI
jgi:tRNA threonylcarbamoyladenosine biosynthesis protein TsaE